MNKLKVGMVKKARTIFVLANTTIKNNVVCRNAINVLLLVAWYFYNMQFDGISQ